MQISKHSALAPMVPILSGYIAYSIADRIGLTPGLVGGMLAVSTNAGFLGGIIAGFMAGYVAKSLNQYFPLPIKYGVPKTYLNRAIIRHVNYWLSHDDLYYR